MSQELVIVPAANPHALYNIILTGHARTTLTSRVFRRNYADDSELLTARNISESLDLTFWWIIRQHIIIVLNLGARTYITVGRLPNWNSPINTRLTKIFTFSFHQLFWNYDILLYLSVLFSHRTLRKSQTALILSIARLPRMGLVVYIAALMSTD